MTWNSEKTSLRIRLIIWLHSYLSICIWCVGEYVTNRNSCCQKGKWVGLRRSSHSSLFSFCDRCVFTCIYVYMTKISQHNVSQFLPCHTSGRVFYQSSAWSPGTHTQCFAVYQALAQIKLHLSLTPSPGDYPHFTDKAFRRKANGWWWLGEPGWKSQGVHLLCTFPADTCNIPSMVQIRWCWPQIFSDTRWNPEYLGIANKAEGVPGKNREGRGREGYDGDERLKRFEKDRRLGILFNNYMCSSSTNQVSETLTGTSFPGPLCCLRMSHLLPSCSLLDVRQA